MEVCVVGWWKVGSKTRLGSDVVRLFSFNVFILFGNFKEIGQWISCASSR